MEVLRLPGYTEQEKSVIAKRFLIPKQMEANGLKTGNLEFVDDGVQAVIRNYTREAGVRNLEREISSICRKVARTVLKDPAHSRVTLEPKTSGITWVSFAIARASAKLKTKLVLSPDWHGPKSEEKF
jgi:ATP-dependent Lon protease